MRKVVLIVISLFIVCLSIFSYFNCQKYTNLEKKNIDISREINQISKETNKVKLNNDEIAKEINDLTSKLSVEINEYNIWIEMKEKLEKSLLD